MTIQNQRGGREPGYAALPSRPYRRYGQDWDPAAQGPLPVTGNGQGRRLQRQERMRRFAELRAEDVPVEEASAVIGIAAETGRDYERRRVLDAADGAR
jgi:hypothetical protein